MRVYMMCIKNTFKWDTIADIHYATIYTYKQTVRKTGYLRSASIIIIPNACAYCMQTETTTHCHSSSSSSRITYSLR